jgi:hypothetical protein
MKDHRELMRNIAAKSFKLITNRSLLMSSREKEVTEDLSCNKWINIIYCVVSNSRRDTVLLLGG